MSRRTVARGLLEDHYLRGIEIDGERDPLRADPRDYVSVLVDGTAFERLLWREINQMIKRAHLSDWQDVVFRAYLKGLTIEETALLFQIPKSTAQSRLDVAQQKAAAVKHRGLLTVMIETLGLPAVREHMADVLELRIDRRQRNQRRQQQMARNTHKTGSKVRTD